ncbi:putative ran guanine nucleotide release factor [Smittium culicis]|uniref:Putative ran guanine nucleotide release factor n=1 Tax=Smittium culicis TaxID=133412 RepID=A0A1R1YEX0_9FUNG|nr:putative ran guanine nucleotide release factor [Smittium culicis]
MSQELFERPLFGGAITATLPKDQFMDVSEFRQVPDNQEVFVHSESEDSFIIEILEFIDAPDDQALRAHYEELSQDNGSTDTKIINEIQLDNIPGIDKRHAAYCLVGQQKAAKFNKDSNSDFSTLTLIMVLIRLYDVNTDLLITVNYPNLSSPLDQRLASVIQIVNSIRITDWSLFFTKVNGNKAWENLLSSEFRAASQDTTLAKKDAVLVLDFIKNRAKHTQISKKYSNVLSSDEQLKRTANLVGFQMPKTPAP